MDAIVLNKAEDLAKEIATQASTLDELNGVLRLLMKAALEQMLGAELTVHLNEEARAAAEDPAAAAYFRYEMTPRTKQEQKQLPHPGRGCKLPSHRFEFWYDPKAAEQAARCDGFSALVTTSPRTLSVDEAFTGYKQPY